jgi:NIMA (never in mitosis gene a)-related kinase
LFVRKEINYGRMSEKERRQMVNEVNILNKLRHPNIVRYHERVIDHDLRTIYIIMEYCSGGDLAAVIKYYKSKK